VFDNATRKWVKPGRSNGWALGSYCSSSFTVPQTLGLPVSRMASVGY
jgi:hypothetical protein